MLRRVVLRQALVLQHVEQSRLPGIVQSQEEDLCVFLSKTEEIQSGPEPVNQEHLLLQQPAMQQAGAKRTMSTERS